MQSQPIIRSYILGLIFAFTVLPFVANAAEPYASGTLDDISWQLRLNRYQCRHAGQAATWCDASDHRNAIAQSGIEEELLAWINDPLTRYVRMSYMTFTSDRLAQALCEASKRSVKVDIYLQGQNIESLDTAVGVYRELLRCSENSQTFHIWKRGTENWLNHAKIFLVASDDSQNPQQQRIRFTSSSANLSQSGLGLHYDNWLMFDTSSDNYLARENLCFFQGLEAMVTPEGQQNKGLFLNTLETCHKTIKLPADAQIDFIATPTPSNREKPLTILLGLIEGAKNRIRIAAHKVTMTGSKKFPLVETLIAQMKKGVKVDIVFDDDTILKHLRAPGSVELNVSKEELRAYEELSKHGANITFFDTNESAQIFMHNKYMIIDDSIVFTGAGNFSSASLLGVNTEQFYVLTVPELVTAYGKSWEELREWSFDPAYYSAQLE